MTSTTAPSPDTSPAPAAELSPADALIAKQASELAATNEVLAKATAELTAANEAKDLAVADAGHARDALESATQHALELESELEKTTALLATATAELADKETAHATEHAGITAMLEDARESFEGALATVRADAAKLAEQLAAAQAKAPATDAEVKAALARLHGAIVNVVPRDLAASVIQQAGGAEFLARIEA